MKLSILICTVPSRVEKYLPKMINNLDKQAEKHKEVEVLYLGDNKRRSVGEKRNDLLRLAKGDYVAFVDDDDEVTQDYVKMLLWGIESGADVVNFKVSCSVNGGEYKDVIYDARFHGNQNHKDQYWRLPNHIMCIKKELALKAGFLEINMGEDDEFAKRLKPSIKTQASIDKVLYYYIFSHQTSETQ